MVSDFKLKIANWKEIDILEDLGNWVSGEHYTEGQLVTVDDVEYLNILERGSDDLPINTTPEFDNTHWNPRYTITGIDEPTGFDSLKLTMERTTNHGMSTEISVESIEFDGVGAELIAGKYETDIDAEIYFEVDSLGYSGFIDLGTFKRSDIDYNRVSCKIGEAGDRTTFNNRNETVVNLWGITSIDGDELADYPHLKQFMAVPDLPLRFTNLAAFDTDWLHEVVVDKVTSGNNITHVGLIYQNSKVAEFGAVELDSEWCLINIADPLDESNGQELIIKYDVKFSAYRESNLDPEYGTLNVEFVVAFDNGGYVEIFRSAPQAINLSWAAIDLSFSGSVSKVVNKNNAAKISTSVEFIKQVGTAQESAGIFVKAGSYISMQYDSVRLPTAAQVSMIHEGLSRVCEITAGLTVKSDFYGRFDSDVNPLAGTTIGSGALKSFTSGINLRGKITDIPISFKTLFESLQGLDAIGWGFSEENGSLFIRVEEWPWFYKSDVVLTLDEPEGIEEEIDVKRIYSGLELDPGKFTSRKDLYSAGTLYSKRTYTNGLKSVNNSYKAKSDFILDPYLIEITKRVEYNKTASEDASLFAFAMRMDIHNVISVDVGVTDSGDTLLNPDAQINFRLSPIRIAKGYRSLIAMSNYAKGLTLLSSDGSTNILGKPKIEVGYRYLRDTCSGVITTENQYIAPATPILRPGTVKVKYPISMSNYKAVKSNPYGAIRITRNGINSDYNLHAVEYTVSDGLANFVLTPRI